MPITSADATEPQISQKDAIVQDLLMDIRLFKTSWTDSGLYLKRNRQAT